MKKCSRCSKPATLHITELREGVAHELHLCEVCAQQYLSHSEPTDASDEVDLLAEKLAEVTSQEDLEEFDQHVCPNCGISFREFRTQGRLGCPHDYAVFEAELLPLLENIHGETRHVGKVPRRAPAGNQEQYRLIKMRNDLRAAIDEERYEAAARLRDEIQQLESQQAAEGAGSE